LPDQGSVVVLKAQQNAGLVQTYSLCSLCFTPTRCSVLMKPLSWLQAQIFESRRFGEGNQGCMFIRDVEQCQGQWGLISLQKQRKRLLIMMQSSAHVFPGAPVLPIASDYAFDTRHIFLQSPTISRPRPANCAIARSLHWSSKGWAGWLALEGFSKAS